MNKYAAKTAANCRRLSKGLRSSIILGSVLVPAFLLVNTSTVSAESLAAALKSAYMNHPGLRAERARQRGTDENLPQVLSGWRPNVTANADAGVTWTDSKGFPASTNHPAGFSITLNQPIFNGFKTVEGTKQAKAIIKAGNQQLLSVEQNVLLAAATAYMDVIRDRTIVRLRRKNVSVLGSQLSASRARFSVGEITRTDVAQSRARLAAARADLAVARANLASSTASYIRVVGHKPGRLRYPGRSRQVPKSLNYALAIAAKTSPQILAAAFNRQAAEAAIAINKGDLLPTLSFRAQYSLRQNPSTLVKRSGTGTVQGVLSVPLYQGGAVYSRIRQAKQVESQRRLQVIDAQRQVRQSVVSTWNSYLAAGQTITSINSQIRASSLALSGIRQEAKVGSRTTLDILDAERELVNAQVNRAQASRNRIVAGYQLVSSIGRMTARYLRLSVPVYNAYENGAIVRDKWFGTSIKKYK